MKVNLIAYGIARDILDGNRMTLETGKHPTIGDIKEELIRLYPDFEALRNLRLAVNEDYQADDYVVSPSDEVVIIPPVSGG